MNSLTENRLQCFPNPRSADLPIYRTLKRSIVHTLTEFDWISLTHWLNGIVVVILKVLFSYSVYRVALPVELLSCELYRTSLVRSQHWFRKWLGAANNPCMLPFLEVYEWSAWYALIKGVCMTTCKTYGIVFLYLFTSLARFCGVLLVLLMPWITPLIHVRRFTIMFVATLVS